MTPRPLVPRWKSKLLLLFGVVASIALHALPLHGQVALANARSEYAQAKAAYLASVEARESIRMGQLRAIDAMAPARESGQASRIEIALREAQAWGNNLSGAEAQVARRRSELRDAVEDLLAELRAAAADLEANLLGPLREPSIMNGWRDSLRETREHITQLEVELQELEEEVSPVGIVLVEWDRRTSPGEYLDLAELHEGRVQTYEDLIAASEAQIRIWERERATELELRTQGRWESNPAGGRPPLGGSLSFEELRTGQIANEREKQERYRATRDIYREQARIARDYAAGREP